MLFLKKIFKKKSAVTIITEEGSDQPQIIIMTLDRMREIFDEASKETGNRIIEMS
jgi:hypothetical protein